MLDLRPLIVVSGTVHVEGGEKNKVRATNLTTNGTRQEIVVDRSVSQDRKAANVIVTDYWRRLKAISLLRTPYGVLLDPQRLDDFKAVLAHTAEKILDFNTSRRGSTRLTSHVLWEPLEGKRRAAVVEWVQVKRGAKDVAVTKAFKELRATSSAAA
jgi:hypothetical protein